MGNVNYYGKVWVLVSSIGKISTTTKKTGKISNGWAKWVLVSSTNKVFNDWIRDLGLNLCLHQKLIGVLIWW